MKIQYPDSQIQLIDNFKNKNINLVCGSFNPLHDGHRQLYFSAQQYFLNEDTFFEVSQERFSKEKYSDVEYRKILDQFRWYAPVLYDTPMSFLDKILYLRDTGVNSVTFHIGADVLQSLHKCYGFDGFNWLLEHFDGFVAAIVYPVYLNNSFITPESLTNENNHIFYGKLMGDPLQIRSSDIRQKERTIFDYPKILNTDLPEPDGGPKRIC